MTRRPLVLLVGATGVVASLTVGASGAQAASATCTAYGPSGAPSCAFTAVNPSQSVWTGVVAATNSTYTITVSTENPRDATGHYTNWEGQRCVIRLWNRTPTVPPAAGTLNADGTRFTGSGPGSRSLDFTDWCTYTLHVDSGIVTAGEAGEETAA